MTDILNRIEQLEAEKQRIEQLPQTSEQQYQWARVRNQLYIARIVAFKWSALAKGGSK